MSQGLKVLDETREQYQKQIKRIINDPVGLELLGETLGLKFKKHEELKTAPIVAVLVPSYKGLHPKMMDSSSSMVRYSQKFCTVWSEPIQGSSLISWVRNDMLARLYNKKVDFSHVLFIDDDMVVEDDYLIKLLRHECDVVGVSYTHRSDPPQPNVHLIDLKTSEAHRVLSWKQKGIELSPAGVASSSVPGVTLSVGTGVMLIRKEVLDRVGEMYDNCEYERQLWNLTDEQVQATTAKRKAQCAQTGNHFWFQLLPRMNGFGESGEDSSFCLKAAVCGYKVSLDSTMTPGHVGEYEYSYSDYLPYQAKEINKARAQGWYGERELKAELVEA